MFSLENSEPNSRKLLKIWQNFVVATLILIEIHNRPMGRTANDVSLYFQLKIVQGYTAFVHCYKNYLMNTKKLLASVSSLPLITCIY